MGYGRLLARKVAGCSGFVRLSFDSATTSRGQGAVCRTPWHNGPEVTPVAVLPRIHFFVCTNTRHPTDPMGSCGGNGGTEVYERLRREVLNRGLYRDIWVTRTGCMSLCNQGPVVVVYPQDEWYHKVRPDQVRALLAHYLPAALREAGDAGELPPRLPR
jgi:(2Fe-2S) ferredoxin